MEEREAMPEQIPPSPCYLCSEMCYDNPALSYNSELHLLSGEWPCREGGFTYRENRLSDFPFLRYKI